jgi:hypothetical protein
MGSANRRRQVAASVDTTDCPGKTALVTDALCGKTASEVRMPPIQWNWLLAMIDHMASTVTSEANVEPPSRRSLFALSAALAATVLTGALAVAGLARHVPAAPTTPQIGQTITPATTARPARVEPGD